MRALALTLALLLTSCTAEPTAIGVPAYEDYGTLTLGGEVGVSWSQAVFAAEGVERLIFGEGVIWRKDDVVSLVTCNTCGRRVWPSETVLRSELIELDCECR